MDMKTQHMKYFKSINGYFRVPSIGEYNYSGKTFTRTSEHVLECV